jgi:hypothetical protein
VAAAIAMLLLNAKLSMLQPLMSGLEFVMHDTMLNFATIVLPGCCIARHVAVDHFSVVKLPRLLGH